jgi:hypothetical protein
VAFTELRLTPEQQDALSTLLERSRENTLDDDQRRRLDELMRVYERGLLRKAQALRAAVQRGLLEPLHARTGQMSLRRYAILWSGFAA